MQSLSPTRISIIVPVLNGADVITGALQSLVSQTDVDVQIIVVDGGSRDCTLETVAAFADRVDTVISEPDSGQADALNKGFARADGDLFGWLCADDRLRPGALSGLAGLLDARPDAVLATAGCQRRYTWGDEVTFPSADFASRLSFVNTIEQPSTLWRAEAYRHTGSLDTSLRYAFDWDFWLRLRRQGLFTAGEFIASEYVFSGSNLTATGGDALADEMYQVIKRHGPESGSLADAYRFLYRVFDKRGFYDVEQAERLPGWARAVHHLVLAAMHRIYGHEKINSYNWNFASRQARGLDVF